ncbi:MAG: ACT domain-containing protein [Lachnospiraceae bacterium]|nr:ACT domain-containing protein [Lachnospiraceae bacterium]MBP1585914.1 ACT domain-containing protein [Lachnospiraceae bacterium]
MSVKQISIFLENKPGKMCEMTEVLAERGINMRGLSLAETEGFGIVRIIVDDVYEATTVLKDGGYINKLTSVVVAEIPDIPGGLSQILKVFAGENINLAYMYALSTDRNSDKAYMVFRVDDHKAAQAALTRAGIRVVSQEDIATL